MTAIVTAMRLAAQRPAGYFEVGFLREKENGIGARIPREFIWIGPFVKIGWILG